MSAADKFLRFLDVEAKALGFDTLGIVSPDGHELLPERLSSFIEAGYHGQMNWLAETQGRRSNPKTLWSDAESIIVLGMNYGPESNPLETLEKTDRAALSVYARNRDYHDVIKGRLKTLASKLASHIKKASADNNEMQVKVFVDTAPVMEKPLAQKAGIGWQGKHTNLVSREYGSWLFLCSIFTNQKLPLSAVEKDHCGSCSDCLDICPTQAFPAPYQLDARRCISYLTIEHKGEIPLEFRKAMGNRIYGCDDCLAVCPWNKFAREASEAKLSAPASKEAPYLSELLLLDDAAFRQKFSGSPVKRIGRNRFIRNCLIAAGNSQDQTLCPVVEIHTNSDDPVIVEAAQWAVIELSERNEPQ